MKKLNLCFLIVISLLLMANPISAASTSYDSLPTPDWSIAHKDSSDIIRKVAHFARTKDYLYFMDSSGKVTVYKEKTRAKVGTVDVISSSRVIFAKFGYKNEIFSNGNMSFITAYMDEKKNREFFQLRVYSPNGKKLWGYTFTEKSSDEVGSYIMNDGTLLVHLKLNTSKYVTYRFSADGKLLNKKSINEFMYYKQNGFITTLSNWSSAGEYKSTLSFYDDHLNKSFSYRNIGLSFMGILKDKTMLFTKFDQGETTAVIAKNSQGKTLWTKTLPESAGPYIGNTKISTNSFLMKSKTSIYAFDSKGFINKTKISSNSFELFESDEGSTILFQDQNQLGILDRKSLKIKSLYKFNMDLGDGQLYYEGKGIVYVLNYASSNVSKFTLSY
ncbi:hypothetical protein CXK86_20645 [Paenibacillus sp. BGI2013]|nr:MULTISPECIES: hypothetical protein [unclassified Paenibacillus]PKQ89455.1 hypothetical protein CXK86_20645 [Paenibacillus sp. BGI2013]SDD52382.1 hypothetical protein SAMN05428987_5119 [Paenibacillus sp. CF095]